MYWNIEAETGYTPQTTFFEDFSIAEIFGGQSDSQKTEAVRDTFARAFHEWKSNYVYLTELVMVLHWKLWYHHELGRENLAKTYDDLWQWADAYACDTLSGDELAYFYSTTN